MSTNACQVCGQPCGVPRQRICSRRCQKQQARQGFVLSTNCSQRGCPFERATQCGRCQLPLHNELDTCARHSRHAVTRDDDGDLVAYSSELPMEPWVVCGGCWRELCRASRT
jgi:hypothetical protein